MQINNFGSTSYRSGSSTAEVSLKKYKYVGKERDDETGLYYYGARYYAAWVGRWISTDPLGMVDGPNLYVYVLNNPVKLNDPSGTQVEAEPQTGIEPTIRDLVKINENIVKPEKPVEKTVKELKEEKKINKSKGDFDKEKYKNDVTQSKEAWQKYNNELEKYDFFESLITGLETAANESPLGKLRDVILANKIPILLSAGTNLVGKTGKPSVAQTQLSISTKTTDGVVTESRISQAEITFDYEAILKGAQTDVTTQLNEGLMDIQQITATALSIFAHELGHFEFDVKLLGGPSLEVGIDPNAVLDTKKATEDSEDFARKVEKEHIIYNRRRRK